MWYMTLILMLTLILSFIGSLLSMKLSSNKEKNSPYECGFDNLSKSRSMFSIQFFVITIVFIIFDVELSIILPFAIILQWVKMWKFFFISSTILILLSAGLIYEWKKGALLWMK